MTAASFTIWTLGHSTRTIEEFLDLLREHQIEILVDVRHFPGSRRFPHFNKPQLADTLGRAGIRYEHLVELGGRRPVRRDSHNVLWRNASFRGYADYMETGAFRDGLARLLKIARTGRTAIMCSEALWWRCHRSMIADDLKAKGVRVLHIMGLGKVQEHPYTSAARLVDGRLSYEGPSLFTFDPLLQETVTMTQNNDIEKVARFETALNQLVERVAEDRYVLAMVLVGSLSVETIWHRESIGLWIIEADGVSRRLPSDGQDERIFRILVENGINIHAEVISRSRFKKMVEGASRTAFSCNFFAVRKVVYSKDPSIESWFKKANNVALKDQERELLTFSTWTIHASRHARKRLDIKGDLELAAQETVGAAHSVAHTEIIRRGEICEHDVIYRAIEGAPALFQTIYLDVLAKRKNRRVLSAALDAIDGYLDEHYQHHLKPLLSYLKKQNRLLPLSEISDQFAFSQLHPWHLESACEWLERKGLLQKLSAPFKLTKRSLERVEEPAYFLNE